MYTDLDFASEIVLDRIRELNDETRRRLPDGHVFLSRGIASLSCDAQADLLERVRTYDAFTSDSDPFGEHDFGSFYYESDRIFWKIDYYDAAMEFGSEDPSDPALTTRVLTVMLAGEY